MEHPRYTERICAPTDFESLIDPLLISTEGPADAWTPGECPRARPSDAIHRLGRAAPDSNVYRGRRPRPQRRHPHRPRLARISVVLHARRALEVRRRSLRQLRNRSRATQRRRERHHRDQTGTYWIATGAGLVRFDPMDSRGRTLSGRCSGAQTRAGGGATGGIRDARRSRRTSLDRDACRPVSAQRTRGWQSRSRASGSGTCGGSPEPRCGSVRIAMGGKQHRPVPGERRSSRSAVYHSRGVARPVRQRATHRPSGTTVGRDP